MSEPGYIPPHSIEAEQAVLGAVFVDPTMLDDVRGVLKPADFWRASHQVIWEAMLTANLGTDNDWVTIGEQVRKMGRVDECGGSDALHAYLAEISVGVPSAYGLPRYAAIVKDRALRREVILRASDVRQMALDDTRTAGDAVAQFNIEAAALIDDAVTTPDTSGDEAMGELEHLYSHPPETISTTYGHLDASGEFTLGSLNTISARPGHGKSSLAANMAERMHRVGIGVGVITLEMQRSQFSQLMLSIRADVPRSRHAKGALKADELERVLIAREEFQTGWRISEKPMTVEQISSLARRWQKKNGVRVVLIDHLQRIRPTDARMDPVQNIAHITWSLAELARSTGLVIVMGAQLNREAEKDRGTVQQRHLKGGGSIEEDSAMVIQIKVDEALCKPDDVDWVMDLVKVKDRYGSLSRCPMRFFKTTGRMIEIDTRRSAMPQFGSVA